MSPALQRDLLGDGVNAVGVIGRGQSEVLLRRVLARAGAVDWPAAYQIFKSAQYLDDIELVRRRLLGPAGRVTASRPKVATNSLRSCGPRAMIEAQLPPRWQELGTQYEVLRPDVPDHLGAKLSDPGGPAGADPAACYDSKMCGFKPAQGLGNSRMDGRRPPMTS